MLLPVTSVPEFQQVDADIFRLRMHGTCMTCSWCNDSCCQYGCDVNLGERDRLLALAPELGPFVQAPPERWFKTEVHADPEYPTGGFVRSELVGGSCVFLSQDGRGCAIHRFAVKTGRDYHALKPMVCWLFPVCWDQRVLRPSYDVRDDLVCRDRGLTLYEAVREELEHAFGPRLTEQLDRYHAEVAPRAPGGPRRAAEPASRALAPGL